MTHSAHNSNFGVRQYFLELRSAANIQQAVIVAPDDQGSKSKSDATLIEGNGVRKHFTEDLCVEDLITNAAR